MFDKSEKKVSEIQIGEKVINDLGEELTIKNIVSGFEKKITWLTTLKGNQIYLSNSHPIETKRGIIKVQDLNAADYVKMNYGYDEIQTLTMIDYNDTVYNLVFEGENKIIANGFIVGDFNLQNNIPNKKRKKIFVDEYTKMLQADFKELFDLLKKKRGAIND